MHAAIGLVPSGALIVLMQVYSRVFLVCGSLLLTQGATTSPGLPLCILAWSITEIIRYGYYTLNLVNMAPQTLLVLRFVLLNINSGKFLVAFWCLSFNNWLHCSFLFTDIQHSYLSIRLASLENFSACTTHLMKFQRSNCLHTPCPMHGMSPSIIITS